MLTLLMALAASGATVPTQSSVEQKKDPLVCTKEPIGSEVGTRMRSKRVCMKKSDRDFIEQEQRATVREINNDGNDRLRFIPRAPR